jgi:predicted adenine nucleotide alpha hydrolase (AANH) superfamily ATPase
VDSHFFLEQLQKDYPDDEIVSFFYDPNIHPFSEYQLRLLDVKYSCEKLGIKLIEGEYDFDNWIKAVKGLEKSEEKGDRCTVCFDKRLQTTAQKAIELGHSSFTTTLLISPLKSQEKLKNIGETIAYKNNLKFIFKDYRSGQGIGLQAKEVKNNSLYRQDYCGCIYALNIQREYQDKLCDELISPINKQVLPDSIEERIELYKQRDMLETTNQEYKVIKKRFLNYRLLSAKVLIDKKVVPSYFICYSTLQNKKVKGKIEYKKDDIYYLNKNEVKIIDLDTFNSLNNTKYKTTIELIWSPLKFEDELSFRDKVLDSGYDLSCLIILDTICDKKIEIDCNSKIYEDVKEEII